MDNVKIGLVDDHNLFRKGLSSLLNAEKGFEVVIESSSGEELLSRLSQSNDHQHVICPDVILSDIKMNGMFGYELVKKLTIQYPKIKVIALSMYTNEMSVIKMIKSGARSYIQKGAEPWELIQAIKSTHKEGYFLGNDIAQVLISQVQHPDVYEMTNVEIEFVRHCCSELSYREIAVAMSVSQRTIDGYREKLFPKLGVRTRIGVVLYAFKHGIYTIDT